MCAAVDRLVDINITVSDLKIETAIRICADPCLIMNGRSLTAKIRKGYQISCLALLALREIDWFQVFHLPP
jgi:hypothetical protein